MDYRKLWAIIYREEYTEQGAKEMERLYTTLLRIVKNLSNQEIRGICYALDSKLSEALWLLEDIVHKNKHKETGIWGILNRDKYTERGVKELEEVYANLVSVAKKMGKENFEELYKAVNKNLDKTLWILENIADYWFGKGCEWQLVEHTKVDNVYCCIQQGGRRDFKGNCSIEFCPLAREELRITEPNTYCTICGKPLNIYNVSRREWSEDLRLDSLGRAWCIKCTEVHDSIDWDEVHEW